MNQLKHSGEVLASVALQSLETILFDFVTSKETKPSIFSKSSQNKEIPKYLQQSSI
jgi:hypothetical protein